MKRFEKDGKRLVIREQVEQVESLDVAFIKQKIADYKRVIAEKKDSLKKFEDLLEKAKELQIED